MRQPLRHRCAGPTSQRVQVAALLDLENLLYMERRTSPQAVRSGFQRLVRCLRSRGDVRFAVGCCDRWLAGMLAPVAVNSGVRIHPCMIGRECADRELLRRAADLPRGADLVVVGSGDHAFAPLVAGLGLSGRRTLVIGRAGGIATSMRAAADEVLELGQRSLGLPLA